MIARRSFILGLMAVIVATMLSSVSASVFLHRTAPSLVNGRSRIAGRSSSSSSSFSGELQRSFRRRADAGRLAMAIPGDGVVEQIFLGGFGNFLQIYNLVITARVLLSWFPQAQSIGVLQPVFLVTDPYLNLFRGLIPPVFGFDLSPLLAFFTLNVLTSTTASIGCEIPDELKKRMKDSRFNTAANKGKLMVN
eukprot:scaffold23358_cov47-Attheya_sp.AAC.5